MFIFIYYVSQTIISIFMCRSVSRSERDEYNLLKPPTPAVYEYNLPKPPTPAVYAINPRNKGFVLLN